METTINNVYLVYRFFKDGQQSVVKAFANKQDAETYVKERNEKLIIPEIEWVSEISVE